MIAFIVSLLSYIFVMFIKLLWGRVRFRDISYAVETGNNFTRWFIANGPNGNRSFFSSHVLSAITFGLIYLIPPIFKVKNKIILAFIYTLPGVLVASMMYARIAAGAHYLSDTTMAIVAYTVIYLLVVRFGIFNIFKERDKYLLQKTVDNTI